MQFHFHANQSHFHKNGFALRLALKQRHKGTRKWPMVLHSLFGMETKGYLVMAYCLSNLQSTDHSLQYMSQAQRKAKLSVRAFPFFYAFTHHKISKINPGAYIFQRPFLRGLFEGLIFGGLSTEGNLCSKCIGLVL